MFLKMGCLSGQQRNKGSILLISLLLFQVLLAGMFLFSQSFINLNHVVRLQDDDTGLELLGLSGAARAEWLVACGRDSDYRMSLFPSDPARTKSILAASPVPFREEAGYYSLKVAFDQDSKHLCILAQNNRRKGISAERLFYGTISAETGKVEKLSYY